MHLDVSVPEFLQKVVFRILVSGRAFMFEKQKEFSELYIFRSRSGENILQLHLRRAWRIASGRLNDFLDLLLHFANAVGSCTVGCELKVGVRIAQGRRVVLYMDMEIIEEKVDR